MKQIIFGLLFLLSTTAQAQTSLIAFKSHAGNPNHYVIDPNSNFGEPFQEHFSFKKINDSTFIKSSGYTNRIDTIHLAQDDLHTVYIVNPTDSSEIIQSPINQVDTVKTKIESPVQPPIKETKKVKRKKNKSFFWFIFGSTGGTLLLLFAFRDKKRNVQFA